MHCKAPLSYPHAKLNLDRSRSVKQWTRVAIGTREEHAKNYRFQHDTWQMFIPVPDAHAGETRQGEALPKHRCSTLTHLFSKGATACNINAINMCRIVMINREV